MTPENLAMKRTHANDAAGDLATLFQAGVLAEQTDTRLLERFLIERDQTAFAILVERHGPLVMAICRRELIDPHAASDAFQQTFLLLADKADRLVVRDTLGRWLAVVAKKVAIKARARARKLARREQLGSSLAGAAKTYEQDFERSELRAIVRDELAGLPERYRRAIVLFHLEGLTHEETAHSLGCGVGTVKSRLNRGRERLRLRLVRRGVHLSAAASVGLLAEDASAGALPVVVPAATSAVVAGTAILSQGGLTMVVVKLTAAALTATACFVGGLGLKTAPEPGRLEAGASIQEPPATKPGPPGADAPPDPPASRDRLVGQSAANLMLQEERQRLRAENESLRKRIADLESKINQLSAKADVQSIEWLIARQGSEAEAQRLKDRAARAEQMLKKGDVSKAQAEAEQSRAPSALKENQFREIAVGGERVRLAQARVEAATAELKSAQAKLEALRRPIQANTSALPPGAPPPTALPPRGEKPDTQHNVEGNIRVTVAGEVKRPGAFHLPNGTRALELLLGECGGFTPVKLTPAETEAFTRAVKATDLGPLVQDQFLAVTLENLIATKTNAVRRSITLHRPGRGEAQGQSLPIYPDAIREGDDTTNYVLRAGDRVEVKLSFEWPMRQRDDTPK